MPGKKANKAYLETPLGIATIEGSEEGISKISILETNEPNDLPAIPSFLKEAIHQLQEYFAGEREEFHLKLNPSGTEFQKKVWKQLETIPFGVTKSYLELAKELGNLKALRAVAAANGRNPLWIVTPCHRVIGTNGSLTGYAGGLWRKKWLLEHEQGGEQQTLFPEL